ncbi:MAG: DUF2752 domain-containing protein [Myxococcota bacterium]
MGSQSSLRLYHSTIFVVCAVVVLASIVLSPTAEAVSLFGFRIPELCTFRRVFGMSCPGCGLTRSFTFMGHGQILEAFRMHALGPIFYVFVAGQLPLRAYRLLGNRAR